MSGRLTSADAGCYVDGHWGIYGTARVVEIAAEFGYPDEEDLSYAKDVLRSMGPSDHESSPESWERISDSADAAESWLTECIAPEGYSFGWHDGEFFLWSDAEWEEEW